MSKTYSLSFYGFISHLGANEVDSKSVVYVTPVNGKEALEAVESALLASTDALQDVPIDELTIGNLYVVVVGERFKRCVFQKFATKGEETLQVYLLDFGTVEIVGRDQIRGCPEEVEKLDKLGCIRAVHVEPLSPYAVDALPLVKGRYCKCFVGEVEESLTEGPFVEGRVLLEYQCGKYSDVRDLSKEPVQESRNSKIFFVVKGETVNDAASERTVTKDDQTSGDLQRDSKGIFSFGGGERAGGRERNAPFSSSGSRAPKSSHNRDGGFGSRREFFGRRTDDRNNRRRQPTFGRPNEKPNWFSSVYGDRERSHEKSDWHGAVYNRSDVDFAGGDASTLARSGSVMYQCVFKPFEIDRYPKVLRVRFDRVERGNVFLAVNPSLFMNIEREMHTGRGHFRSLPRMKRSNLRSGTGCLAYTAINNECPSYFRGVVAKPVELNNRICVFLVDFAVEQWVKSGDVVDISNVIEENERFMQFPVAMLRCRLAEDSVLNIRELTVGVAYELLFDGKDSDGIFEVRSVAEEGPRGGTVLHNSTEGLTTHCTAATTDGGNGMSIAHLLDIGNQSLAAVLSAKFRFTSAVLASSISSSVAGAATLPQMLNASYVGNDYAMPYGGGVWPMAVPAAVVMPGVGGPTGETVQTVRNDAPSANVLPNRLLNDSPRNDVRNREFATIEPSSPSERRSGLRPSFGGSDGFNKGGFGGSGYGRGGLGGSEYDKGGFGGSGFGGNEYDKGGFGGSGFGRTERTRRDRDRENVRREPREFGGSMYGNSGEFASFGGKGGGQRRNDGYGSDRGDRWGARRFDDSRGQKDRTTQNSGGFRNANAAGSFRTAGNSNDTRSRVKDNSSFGAFGESSSFAKGDAGRFRGFAKEGRTKGPSVWDLPENETGVGTKENN